MRARWRLASPPAGGRRRFGLRQHGHDLGGGHLCADRHACRRAVVVAAGENDDVRLVLENASISSASTAPVYEKRGQGDSQLRRAESYVADADGTSEDTRPAIYAACDPSINGSGTLRISANDAISTKRTTCALLAAHWKSRAADDGLVANDSILIRGALRITAATTSRPGRRR